MRDYSTPVVELLGFPEQEQGSLSLHLSKLGIEAFWLGRDPRGIRPNLRIIRAGTSALREIISSKPVPVAVVADFLHDERGVIPPEIQQQVIWVGGWTADSFALARRLASVAFRLRKKETATHGTLSLRFYLHETWQDSPNRPRIRCEDGGNGGVSAEPKLVYVAGKTEAEDCAALDATPHSARGIGII